MYDSYTSKRAQGLIFHLINFSSVSKWKLASITAFSLFVLVCNSYAVRYDDIFTDEIYDQTGIHFRLMTTEVANQAALDRLYELKQSSLTRVAARTLEVKLQKLQHSMTSEKDRQHASRLTSQMGDVVKSGLSGIPFVGPFLGSVFGGSVTNSNSISRTPRQNLGGLETEILHIQSEMEELQRGLRSEPIAKQEEFYVLHKRFINKDLQQSIADALIQARKPCMSFFNLKDFVDEALALPYEHKQLLSLNDSSIDLLTKYDCFDTSEFFQKFSYETKMSLKKIIAEICYDSIAPEDSIVPLKKFYYLWGNPGIGKSHAARKLVEDILDLPYQEVCIRTGSELTQENLEGSTWYRPNANLGWIIRPFMAKNSTGKRYKNPVLIINDFDRVLLGQSTGALGFLLDYLDGIKKEFHSPYFKSLIDIKRLSIIITGNKPIPEGDGGPTDQYAALRTRVQIIQFAEFTTETSQQILGNYITTLMEHYHFSQELSNTENKMQLVQSALNDCPNKSIRDQKQYLNNAVVNMKINLLTT